MIMSTCNIIKSVNYLICCHYLFCMQRAEVCQHTYQQFITVLFLYSYKKYISQISLSSHNLVIEKGWRNNVQLNNRICKICKRDLKCFSLSSFWRYSQNIYQEVHVLINVFEFAQLLSFHNVHDLCNVGKFVYLVERGYSILMSFSNIYQFLFLFCIPTKSII